MAYVGLKEKDAFGTVTNQSTAPDKNKIKARKPYSIMNETVSIQHKIAFLKISRGDFRYGFHRVEIRGTEVFTFLANIRFLKLMNEFDFFHAGCYLPHV